jgi:Zn-finger protein
MKQQVNWTTKDGKVMSVDDMTEQHAKNALKMMIRRFEELKNIIKKEVIDKQKPKFELHGDIAQDHYDQMLLHEYQEDMGMQDYL